MLSVNYFCQGLDIVLYLKTGKTRPIHYLPLRISTRMPVWYPQMAQIYFSCNSCLPSFKQGKGHFHTYKVPSNYCRWSEM